MYVVILILFFFLNDIVDARPARIDQIPNGAEFGCVTCHLKRGGARNTFGKQIEAKFLSSSGFSGEVIWNKELASLDADGDGASNGLELGDPEGLWRSGDQDPVGEVYRPWDADSVPQIIKPIPTLILSVNWAKVKRFNGLFE
tara:strand:+ start:190 stop:618 length:429 start_codon:yes stop_codon:yes gene_type:complete